MAAPATSVCVRRSPFLVTYWKGGTHWAYNYLTSAECYCPGPVRAILEATGHWTSRADIGRAIPDAEDGLIARTIDEMIQDGLLDSADRPRGATEQSLAAWDSWNPVAGFFHAATKALAPIGADVVGPPSARLLVERDFPPALKEYPDHPRFDLPACTSAGPLADVLRSRRTWREFSDHKLTLDEAATLLGLTFGIQQWLEVDDDRWVALKTSPSGGARHSIEAYLLAFNIEGLENGTYHYGPDSHDLRLLDSPTSRELLAAFIPTQPGFHNPAAVVVMTSVFERVQYKYPHPHAYRVVLLDAGHLSQTFALVATALGLAPFCTAALNASRIEKHLGIDGIRESVVLALGVGQRPAGKDWSPMHDHSDPPRTEPPAWATRLPGPSFP